MFIETKKSALFFVAFNFDKINSIASIVPIELSILRNTFTEASNLNASIADDYHLLLAILQETEGVAFEVLKAFEIDYSSILELLKADAGTPKQRCWGGGGAPARNLWYGIWA